MRGADEPATPAQPWPVVAVERFTMLLAVLGGVGLCALLLTVAADVVLRNLANQPIPGALDLVTYWWMPATAILPMAFAELRGEHIRAELLENRLSARWRARLDVAVAVLALPVFAALAYYMARSGLDAMRIGEASSGSTIALPIWPARLLAVLGILGLLLQTAVTVYKLLRAGSGPASEDGPGTTATASASGERA